MSNTLKGRLAKLEQVSPAEPVHVQIVCFCGEPRDPTPRLIGGVLVSYVLPEEVPEWERAVSDPGRGVQ
jgi:hypothetical protein